MRFLAGRSAATIAAAALVVVALMASCGGDDDTATPSASPTEQATATGPTPTRTPVNVPITQEITVFAASSLTAAFTQIAEDFEARYPGIGVTLVFAGSQELRTQLEQGAEADVLATADIQQMDLAAASGLVSGLRQIFARNKLIIIVPAGNPSGISNVEDLARDGVKLVIGGENVPVGRYTRAFLEAVGDDFADDVLSNVVSEATNVREIVSAVQLGEVDAGIVYATDVTSTTSSDVLVIDIPDSVNQVAIYPISITHLAVSKEIAQDFVDYVTEGHGQVVLQSFGFGPGGG
jgi:molybdate transport system substrate-binding protein